MTSHLITHLKSLLAEEARSDRHDPTSPEWIALQQKGLVRWSELLQAWRLAVSKDEAIAAMAVAVLEQPEVHFQDLRFPWPMEEV